MNIQEFNTIGYFIKHYFNWSMNYSDLKSCIEDFLMRERKEDIKSFKKEIETLYLLNNPEVIREVFYKLGNRGIPTNKGLDMIELLYMRTHEDKK